MMNFKDEVDVDAIARAGLEKLGYKQEMTRVGTCSPVRSLFNVRGHR